MSKSGKLSKTQRQFPEEATIVGPPPDVEPTLVGAPLGWAPEPEQPTAVQVEAPIPPPAAVEAPSEPVAEPRPAVEVEVRTVKNPATLARRQLPTYELWTKNRVYNLDATMSCIEVIDLASGRTDKKHTLLGAQLGLLDAGVFAKSESIVAVCVLALLAAIFLIRDNRRALLAIHALMGFGALLIAGATAAFGLGLVDGLRPRRWRRRRRG